jgi:hypothetical protein
MRGRHWPFRALRDSSVLTRISDRGPSHPGGQASTLGGRGRLAVQPAVSAAVAHLIVLGRRHCVRQVQCWRRATGDACVHLLGRRLSDRAAVRLPHLARLGFVWPNIAGVRRLFDLASLRIPFAVNLDLILRSTATLIRGSQSARITKGRAMSRFLCVHRQIAENTELRRHLHILKNAAF